MLRSYFRIALRNVLRHKAIAFINLFGLTVGLAGCLLIALYLADELSYDRFHTHADRIYRLTRNFRSNDGTVSLHLGHVAPPFGPLIRNDFSDIEQVTRLLESNYTFRYGENLFNEERVFFAENNLFDVFTIPVVSGNPKTALTNPFSIMLTEAMAEKYFGKNDPMNQQVRLDNQHNFQVTGVFKALPANSHFHPNFLVSFNTLKDSTIYGEEGLRTNWGNNSFSTFLLLPAKYPAEKLVAQFPAFLDRHLAGESQPGSKPSSWTGLFLDKLTDIHLRSHLDSELEENGDIGRVYIFSAVALFILLIACVNYTNLSTARSALRAKEIGIRKVAGAYRRELVTQFLSESVGMAGVAMVLSVAVAWLALPALNHFTGKSLAIGDLARWYVPVLLPALALGVGLLAGLYPAWFLASFQPATVLKGAVAGARRGVGMRGGSLRQGLVVAQFSVSIVLLICTGVVYRQLRYMQNKSLGFNREHILTMAYPGALAPQYEVFRNALLGRSAIRQVSRSSRIPSGRLLDAMGASVQVGDSVAPTAANIKYLSVDHDFVEAYGMKLRAGRNFSRDFRTDDTAAFLLNEAAVETIGWGRSPAKTSREAVDQFFQYGDRKGKVIGVLQDFHFESLHEGIVPLVLFIPRNAQAYNRVSVKVSGSQIPEALAHLEKTWNRFLPESPFEYTFLEENFGRVYQSEQRQGGLFTTFSAIAIFIACLGLFGLASFTTEQRTKEIGIRKVLGASVPNIVLLLSKDFARLVGWAVLLAAPVAWYAMSRWLQDFAYRIPMPYLLFGAAGGLALLIALLTVSFQAVRAATANPVKSLRNE
ncbi:MAG: ABC transporter permease [Ferruginibacter sp.]|nr:ABC transporter permease [Cytophagales bacterium]